MFSQKRRTTIRNDRDENHRGRSPFPCAAPTEDHGWPGGTDPNVQYNTLVEVRTDEGIIGPGQLLYDPGAGRRLARALRPHLIGETGLEPDRVAEKLRQSMFWLGRGGSVEHTISGLDIALWDLLGRALGQPVSRLLGGNYRDRIKPYASILFDDPPRCAKTAGTAGPRLCAIKMGWRPLAASAGNWTKCWSRRPATRWVTMSN